MAQPLTIKFEVWTLHRSSGELEFDGKRVRLQDLPFQILDELLSHPGEVVTREQLIARLWPRAVVDYEAGLNSSVRRLRAVLQDDAEAPRYIETVPRKGYRYIGGVPQVDYAPAEGSARQPGPAVLAADALVPKASDVSQPATRRSRASTPRVTWFWLAIAIAAGVAAGTTWFISHQNARTPAADPIARRSPAAQLRLAVLPFANLSPDPAGAFFAEGMHEDVMNAIASRAPHLELISRTTMQTYRSSPRSVRDIVRELGVSHVLEGSLRRDQRRLRLAVRLIDARSDVQLWSSTFDRPLTETIALQSLVAEEVGAQLATKLSGNAGELPGSVNPEAYDLYSRARSALQTVRAMRSEREQLKAEALLDRAIAMDDRFASAYLERARVRLSKFVSSQDTSEANLRALAADLAAARRMIGDSPPLLATEAQYAQLVDFDQDKASRLLKRAEAMNPHGSELHLVLARQLASSGNPDEALAHFARAAQLDPANPTIVSDWAATLKMLGRAEESLRISRDFDARYPGRITYGWRLFGFTGQLDRFEHETSSSARPSDASAQLAAHFDLLLYSGRLPELARMLEQSTLTTIPQVATGGFAIPAIGRKPVAELRGWVKLLQNDAAAARRDGQAVLEFVAREPVSKWNVWYLRMLAAEGALFMGDRSKAAAEARAALELAPRDVHPGIQRYARALAARILAWAADAEKAVALLEQLSTSFPQIGPAEIVDDPLYSVPLRHNARFEALAAKLESRLAANRVLRDPPP